MTKDLLAVAAWGLPSARALPQQPLDRGAWRDLLEGVRHERLHGLLLAAVRSGGMPATDEQAHNLHAEALHVAAGDVEVERQLLAAADVLDAAGVDFRVLKGAAVAHTVYPDPFLRSFADVDLLVRPQQWRAACEALHGASAVRPLPELRPGFDRRFGKEATFRTPAGVEVDLHRTLVKGPFGLTVDLPALFEHAATVELGGRRLPTLDDVHALLMAALSAGVADDPPRLTAHRDVAQLLLTGRVNWRRAAELAEQWRIGAPVAKGVALTWTRLGLTDDAAMVQWARARRSRLAERLFLRSYRGSGSGYHNHLSVLFALRDAGDRVAYARAIALPQRSYLKARHRTALTHAAHALRALAPRTWR